jgi:hypothetical protein
VVITLLSVLIGVAIYRVGWAKLIDRNLEVSVPYYRQIAPLKESMWSRPDQGYLAGDILEVNNKTVRLVDLTGRTWLVDLSNSIIRGRASITIGSRIKIIGEVKLQNMFVADEVRPWVGMRETERK